MNKSLLVFVFFGLLSGIVSAQQLELKEVITRSARGIEETLPQRAKVAVLNFESPAKAFSEYVIEELTSELLETGKITVVDRKNLATIMEEMKFQYSGNVSDESMVSIGKMIGAHYIISGTLTDMKTYYRFRVRIINVETAAIQRQITNELKKDTEVAYLMGGDSAVREIERQENMKPTSNVRNNWLSADFSYGYSHWHSQGLSVGAQYERMINSKISLGANFYWFIPLDPVVLYDSENNRYDLENFDRGNIFGIDAFIRFYPWGKKFFLGLALGYHDGGNPAFNPHKKDFWSGETYYDTGHGYGLAITAELGWKIDVGKEGGFFIQPGILVTGIVGNMENVHTTNPSYPPLEHQDYFNGYYRAYLGAGYSF